MSEKVSAGIWGNKFGVRDQVEVWTPALVSVPTPSPVGPSAALGMTQKKCTGSIAFALIAIEDRKFGVYLRDGRDATLG
jgi:hypothetical protein